MKAGHLRHRIELQSVTAHTKNKAGEKIPTWTTYATVWASIKPVSGDESMRGVSSESEVTHSIVIRYQSTVGPKHRILFGTRIFNISNVLDTYETGVWMTLKCTEVVS